MPELLGFALVMDDFESIGDGKMFWENRFDFIDSALFQKGC